MGKFHFALIAALTIPLFGALMLNPAQAIMPGSPAGIRAAIETNSVQVRHVCRGWYAGYYRRCRPYTYYPPYYGYYLPYWGFHGHHWGHHGHFGGFHGGFGHFGAVHGGFGHGGFGHGGGHGHHGHH